MSLKYSRLTRVHAASPRALVTLWLAAFAMYSGNFRANAAANPSGSSFNAGFTSLAQRNNAGRKASNQ